MNNNFTLNNFNLGLLRKKTDIYSSLSGKFNSAYFKLVKGFFIFVLCSNDGIIKTTLNIDYDGDTQYFSIEYPKWVLALQKFAFADSIKFELKKNLLKMYVEGSSDVITLNVVNYDESSVPADKINNFLPTKKAEILDCNHHLVLSDELLNDFDMMNSLFQVQSRINSIGISKEDVIYSERSVVVKAHLSTPLEDALFTDLEDDDKHIYLHSFTLKLLKGLSEFSRDTYFDNNYELLYWADENTELIIFSDDRNVSLPTDEQWEMIKPKNKNVYFDSSVALLNDSLGFFVGFYEGSSWKPLKFEVEKGKDIVLHYSHPTAEVKKTLTGVQGNENGEFLVESETLGKIIAKVKKRYGNEDVMAKFIYDPEGTSDEDRAPGIYGVVGDAFEFVVCTLKED
jgi:hypothetical protein